MQYEIVLGVADAFAAITAIMGYILLSNVKPTNIADLPHAFGALERSIEVNMEGIPRGYTWSETFERLKEEGIKADWTKMREALASYEAYRYGGKDATSAGKDEVIGVAMRLRRGVIGKRTQR